MQRSCSGWEQDVERSRVDSTGVESQKYRPTLRSQISILMELQDASEGLFFVVESGGVTLWLLSVEHLGQNYGYKNYGYIFYIEEYKKYKKTIKGHFYTLG